MDYVPPYGVTDVNGSYLNGDSRIGRQGSIPPAESFEWPMRELVALIDYSGIVPSGDDLLQVTKAVRSQSVNFSIDTGSVNALSVAYDPPFVELNYGLVLRILVAHDNTGPSTLVVNNLVAAPIRRATGAACEAGDLRVGEVVSVVWDGSVWQIVNFFGSVVGSSTSNYYDIGIPYCLDSSTTVNQIIAPFSPAITVIAPGDLVEVMIANVNSGPVTIAVNSLPVKNVKLGDGQPLVANQIIVGMIALLVYDGTNWQLVNPARTKSVSIGGAGQIAGRFMYQDPNYHITSVFNQYVEAFRVSYVPVAADDTIRIQCVGSFNSAETTEMPMGRGINGYLAYSTDGGTTWNPPSWPGRDFRTVGTFKANPAMSEIIEGPLAGAGINRIDFNFTIVGEFIVPAGPPANIMVRLMFTSAYEGNLTTMVHGGTIVEITEYYPLS